jgi:hypothetical protein
MVLRALAAAAWRSVNLLPFKKDIAFLGDRLLGTRAHDTAWTEQQTFLQQCGNAPPARPSDFLRHFFVRPLTILPILDHTSLRLHGRVIVLAFDATERAPAEIPVRKPASAASQIRSKNAQAKAHKRQ